MIVIPGESTLRNYSSVIPTTPGIQGHVLEALAKEAAQLPEEKRYVVLMHDEITVQQDLVFDNKQNLIGYVCQEELDVTKVNARKT